MTEWRTIPMRDINWAALKPSFGHCVYRLRKLSEPNSLPYRPYCSGCWADMTLGQVADLGRAELLRHDGMGEGTIAILEQVMELAAAGHSLTRPRPVRAD
ncbi:hypothetical protein PARHAE_01098 [Paracoccus haematequi]|uniref:Uncharacterized protein n=2 Tax=Paracoccus haematequi TaxID=2491866 RepID=A0A447IK98_9RHOB|nr:hypothetical protein PARHAE_01098 [Paracoccus haematequi]